MKASVIVATLGLSKRPSLLQLLDSLKGQTLPREEWELITDDSGPNEYAARNRAAQAASGEVLAFTDDDCLPSGDWLAAGWRHFADDPRLMILTGPVEGDMWGQGWMKVNRPGWFIGANVIVRRGAFLEVDGFDATWGLTPPPRGWRGDTDLGWRMIYRFGESCYGHFADVRMVHPGRMQSMWDPRVEERFYLRHRERCLKEFAPVDPRLCQFLVKNGVEKDPATLEYLTGLLRNFESQYGLKLL